MTPRRRGPQATFAYLQERTERLCRAHGDRLETKVMRQWIAFRSARRGRTFAEIRLSRRGLQIFLLPPRDTLKDPAGLAETPPPSQGWGWFLTKVSVQGNGHVAQVFGLLRQSYLYSRTLPAARRRR